MEDKLVDNSDDEKWLSRADVRAGKKLKAAAQRGGKNATRKPGPRKYFTGSRYPGYLPSCNSCWLPTSGSSVYQFAFVWLRCTSTRS